MEISEIWQACRADIWTPEVFKYVLDFDRWRYPMDLLKVFNLRGKIYGCVEEVREDFSHGKRFKAEDLRKLNALEQLATDSAEIVWLNMLKACSVNEYTREKDILTCCLDQVEIQFDLGKIRLHIREIEELPFPPQKLSKVGHLFLCLAEDVKKNIANNRLLVIS